MARSFNDVVTDLITNILIENPSIDVLPGQVIRDVFVNGLAQEFANTYNAIDTVATNQSISNAATMSVQALNAYVGNFGITRKPATNSVGSVTFYTNVLPSQNIYIPAGTVLGTGLQNGGQQITFTTVADANLFISLEATYFNIQTGNWELNVNIIAQQPGSIGNVGPYTITTIISSTFGMQVANYNSTTGGYDQESNVNLAVRTINTFLGNGAGTSNGYSGLLLAQPYILDVNVQGPGDPLMVRDFGFGGKVDLWTVPSATTEVQLNYTNTPSLQINPWSDSEEVLSGYVFPFPVLPVDPSEPIVVTATLTPSGNLTNIPLFSSANPAPSGTPYVNPNGAGYHYTVQLDSSLNYGGSIYSTDQLVWNATEMDYLNNLYSGNTMAVYISYSNNSAISSAQSIINLPTNDILCSNAVVKQGIPITLNINANVVLEAAYTETAETEQNTINSIITAITNSIITNNLGQQYSESNLINTILSTPGVNYVVVPSIILSQVFPSYYNEASQNSINISPLPNQFLVVGNIVINAVNQ